MSKMALEALPLVFDQKPSAPRPTPLAELKQVADACGVPAAWIVKSFARLAFGPGKISFADFIKLRLFDTAFHAGGDLTAYVGHRRNCTLNVEANYRRDWLGLLKNKVASLKYLEASGFPIIPILALYIEGVGRSSSSSLRDRADLERFLTDRARYPLFGKPVEGIQSVGAFGLTDVDAATREIALADGSSISIDTFITRLTETYAAGYLFQPLMRPHPRVEAVCGPRLATVRFVTLLCEDGPRLFRAAWKIPTGANTADNYWRRGNLLAQVDIESGRVLRATSGAGLATTAATHHPDSGGALVGFEIPDWIEMRTLALEAARLMRHVPLIGWDIACTDKGPVIVEMNEAPDLFLVQFADRKGVLGPELSNFLAYQKAQAARYAQSLKASFAGI